jgi:uncharacterized protein YqhQ
MNQIKKTKEIFERGAYSSDGSLPSRNVKRIDLGFLIIWAIVVILAYTFLEMTPLLEKILWGICIILILFFLSIRIFGLTKLKKILSKKQK